MGFVPEILGRAILTDGKFYKKSNETGPGRGLLDWLGSPETQNEIACFSNVTHNSKRDYDLDFSNCQLLESLKSKLRRASLILSAHSSIVRSAIKYSNEILGLSNLERLFLHPTQSELQDELWQHLEVLKNQKEKLAMLLESAESTGRIVCKPPFPFPFHFPIHEIKDATQILTSFSHSSSSLRVSTIVTTRSSTKTFSHSKTSHLLHPASLKACSMSRSMLAMTPG